MTGRPGPGGRRSRGRGHSGPSHQGQAVLARNCLRYQNTAIWRGERANNASERPLGRKATFRGDVPRPPCGHAAGPAVGTRTRTLAVSNILMMRRQSFFFPSRHVHPRARAQPGGHWHAAQRAHGGDAQTVVTVSGPAVAAAASSAEAEPRPESGLRVDSMTLTRMTLRVRRVRLIRVVTMIGRWRPGRPIMMLTVAGGRRPAAPPGPSGCWMS